MSVAELLSIGVRRIVGCLGAAVFQPLAFWGGIRFSDKLSVPNVSSSVRCPGPILRQFLARQS